MVVVRPVMLNKKRIGTIFIRASLQEIYDRVKFLGVFTGLVLLGCGLVARTLAVRLQRSISQPIVNLTEAVRALAERSDYTVRLPEQGRNETGSLTAAFNHLLASIGERDKALRGANQSLCQSEAQVQAILENLNDGLIISDLTGQVTSFNRAAMEMHGFTCMHECHQLSEYAKTFELSDLDGTLCPVEQWPAFCVVKGYAIWKSRSGIPRVVGARFSISEAPSSTTRTGSRSTRCSRSRILRNAIRRRKKFIN
jgi:PAS domain-containing protein